MKTPAYATKSAQLPLASFSIEIIPIQQINEAYERIVQSDVRYRFVIDIASLKKS